MRWQEILNERGEAFLYHGTASPDAAAKIVYDDTIRAFTSHRADELGLPAIDGETYINGVSLTRSSNFATGWRSSGNTISSVVFVLDWMKLRHNFRLRPYDYYQSRNTGHRDVKARSEAEEFCITRTGIAPLSRYLVEIRMPTALYDDCVKADEDDYGDSNHPDSMYGPLTHHPLLKLF